MEHTFSKESITSALCNTMIENAFAKANDLGMGIAVTIVDESGVTKAFHRMDNAPFIASDNIAKVLFLSISIGQHFDQ